MKVLKISKKEHNDIFKRKWTWKNHFVYTKEDDGIRTVEYASLKLRIIQVILLPVSVLVLCIKAIYDEHIFSYLKRLYKGQKITHSLIKPNSRYYKELENKF